MAAFFSEFQTLNIAVFDNKYWNLKKLTLKTCLLKYMYTSSSAYYWKNYDIFFDYTMDWNTTTLTNLSFQLAGLYINIFFNLSLQTTN